MKAEHEEKPIQSVGEVIEKSPQIDYLESIYGVGNVFYNEKIDTYFITPRFIPKEIEIQIGFIKL